jgi:hypothetical protein
MKTIHHRRVALLDDVIRPLVKTNYRYDICCMTLLGFGELSESDKIIKCTFIYVIRLLAKIN